MWISTGFKGGFFQLVVAIEELFSADRGNQSGDASLEAWKRAAGWDLLVCKRLQQRSRNGVNAWDWGLGTSKTLIWDSDWSPGDGAVSILVGFMEVL
ncbi:hypothetical protein ACFX2I_015555 [Malus domestica]